MLSAVVHSGRGLHGYWLLRESIPLRAEDQRRRFAARLRALSTKLGGDPAVADVARVLRLPGSLNYKYDPPRPVRLLALRARRYRIEELDRWIGTGPTSTAGAPTHLGPADRAAAAAPPRDRWVSRLLREGAPRRQRNVACARLAGYFRAHGLPPDVVRAIVLGFAPRCRPPVDPREAEAVVRSISRLPSRQPSPISGQQRHLS